MRRLILLLTFFLLAGLLSPSSAVASHAWGTYHWARSANPFALNLGDNVSTGWDAYLGTTASDWSTSSILDTLVVPGATSPKRCRPSAGRVEVCNAYYGRNGWLGLAQIWVSGSHIYQGVTKVNDTYFSSSTYNKPEWRNLVMCQEVGHTLGLDHQDENFSNEPLGSCMDYTSSPLLNQHPNLHDYEELELIYAHLDSFTTLGLASISSRARNGDFDNPGAWGQLVRRQGRTAVYERDLGGGQKLFTFVILD